MLFGMAMNFSIYKRLAACETELGDVLSSKTSKPIAIIRRAGHEKRIARADQETIEEAIIETYLTDASTRRIEGFEPKG